MAAWRKEVADLIRARDRRAQAVRLPQQFEHDGGAGAHLRSGDVFGAEWWAMVPKVLLYACTVVRRGRVELITAISAVIRA